MKPEPLKNRREILHYKKIFTDKKVLAYREKYIKSAVEWLKEEIFPSQKIKEFSQWQIIDLINKAFEDVTKK